MPKERERFEKRILIFSKSKNFFDADGKPLDEKLTLVISASAVQLTFGLALFRMGNFKNIIIHDKEYIGDSTERLYDGHVNESGSIHLSWSAFAFGYHEDHDGLNTGLHEMAHALEIENRMTARDLDFLERIETWDKLAGTEMVRMRDGESSILRSYGSVNLDEMFAVTCECFFELPDQMAKELPDLYAITCEALRQDPRNSTDPVLRGKFYDHPNALRNPAKIIEKNKRPWQGDIPVYGFLIALFSMEFIRYQGAGNPEIITRYFEAIAIIYVYLGIRYLLYLRNKKKIDLEVALQIRKRGLVERLLFIVMILCVIGAFFPFSLLADWGVLPEGSEIIKAPFTIVFVVCIFLLGINAIGTNEW